MKKDMNRKTLQVFYIYKYFQILKSDKYFN